MPPKKKAEGESTVSSKDGKITIHIPLSSFIKEHKNLTNILESGVQDAILAEAESQRKELDDIIAKVKDIKKMEIKPKMESASMETQTEPKKMTEAEKFKAMMEERKRPVGIQAIAPDLRKLQQK